MVISRRFEFERICLDIKLLLWDRQVNLFNREFERFCIRKLLCEPNREIRLIIDDIIVRRSEGIVSLLLIENKHVIINNALLINGW